LTTTNDTPFTYWRKNMIYLETTSGWQLIHHCVHSNCP